MKTIKISYFNSTTESKLEDEDASVADEKEVLEELFNLEEDDESYIRIFTEKTKYQIIGEDYDSYKLFEYEFEDSKYAIIQFCNFEEIKSFMKQLFYNDLTLKKTSNKYIFKDGTRYSKDEKGNLIEDN